MTTRKRANIGIIILSVATLSSEKFFFQNYGHLMDKHHFEATNIYNMDESDFSTIPRKIGKMIAMKGMRRSENFKPLEAERWW